MYKPVAVIAADTHLAPNTWVNRPQIRGDAYRAFTQIIDYCLRNELPLILLGDIFEKAQPDPETISFVYGKMSQMQEYQNMVYFIQGNHDKTSPPWLSVHPWPVHAHQHSFNEGGINFYGIDYTPTTELQAELHKIPFGTDVLLCHQSWRELQSVGRVNGTIESIPRGLMLFTGDLHITTRKEVTNTNGDTIEVYSPGSTCMQSLAESPCKYFNILTDIKTVQKYQLSNRGFHDHDISTNEELCDFVESFRDYAYQHGNDESVDYRPILRVRFNNEIPEALARIELTVGEHFHLFTIPYDNVTDTVVDIDATPTGAFDDLLSAVGTLTVPGSQLYNSLRRLLESAGPGKTTDLLSVVSDVFEDFKRQYAQQQETITTP